MTYDALLDAIYQQLPELKDKLRISRIQYDAAKNRAVFFFHADVLVENGSFGVIKGILQNAFPKLKAALRVASPSLAESFMADPGKYAPVFDRMLQKKLPGISPWINCLQWKSEHGTLVLEVQDDLGMEYMTQKQVTRKLAVMIDDVFQIKPSVQLRLAKDMEKRVERMERLRAEEEKLLSLTAAGEKTGMPADKRSSKEKRIKISAPSPRSLCPSRG